MVNKQIRDTVLLAIKGAKIYCAYIYKGINGRA